VKEGFSVTHEWERCVMCYLGEVRGFSGTHEWRSISVSHMNGEGLSVTHERMKVLHRTRGTWGSV
jgi:hypothetical protein